MGFVFEQPLTAGVNLLRSAIQSPNYVTGSTGWAIFQNGDAEFSGTVTINAGTGSVILNAGGIDIIGAAERYRIAKAGGFIASVIPDDGSFTLYKESITIRMQNPSPVGATMLSAAIGCQFINSGLVNEQPLYGITGPAYSGKANASMFLYGQTNNDAGTDDTSHVDVFARDINLVNDSVNGQISYSRNLVNLATNLVVSPSQFFNVVIAVIVGDTNVALGATNYPVSFPVGATVFGVANIASGAGATSLWYARFIPVSNTQFNVIISRPAAAAVAANITVTVLTWIVA